MSVKKIEVEVLPKEESDPLPKLLAWILDDLIPIPGTNFRIGLDPLIGLIPGLGDTTASAASTLIIIQAFKRRVPRIVILRMVLNVLINGLGGAIPGVGDVFSAWFKSNRRNYELLVRHTGTHRTSTTGDWIFMISVLLFLVAAFVGFVFLSFYLIYLLITGLSRL